MTKDLLISGFSDEISFSLDEQLAVVASLGMEYISLRGIDGKNIGEYTLEEVQDTVKPRLDEAGIGVSSIGSPIGKVFIDDQEGFEKQKAMLDTLCRIGQLLDCHNIRIFSFYIPKGQDPEGYKEEVVAKVKAFAEIAGRYGMVLLHENEKDIYGDTSRRCKTLLDAVDSPHFKAIFDFANFVQVGEDTLDCWELLQEDVAYIHIKDAVSTDSQNVVCGTGEGKIPEILGMAVRNGYKGFLTLEPHLVLFDSLKDLELEDAKEIIKDDKGLDGASGYKLQYEALLKILETIGG
ncbi:sugar phosphate isomerase/epimerase family protein [Anaerotalea alkaliphila]|uniref:Sugar phosphate isomerase/epimerase n=1 Tax=Anaerotalea alkaliphila TaxID=2662126 RepID=A0A7X5KMZ4_9FIRM|nr:sugar phosphate isomerase/epimerase family protein [Anaerotalea alkaliphila]NDL67499.1 sugar phosphate isomerase/epimerase [Anaerotalea alkaliphila]